MTHRSTRGFVVHVPLMTMLPLVMAGCFLVPGSTPSPGTQAPEPPSSGPVTPDTAPPAARPDFAIVGYTRDPAEGLPVPKGTEVTYAIQVTNRGSAAWNNWIVVQGPGNVTGGVQGLAPGETKTATVSLYVGADTLSNIYFRVDPDNVTPEENEANNELGPLTVTGY